MKYILPSREVICDAIEVQTRTSMLDGLVLLLLRQDRPGNAYGRRPAESTRRYGGGRAHARGRGV